MVVSMGGANPGGQREIIALTAARTLTAADMGKVFTNRGAAASVTVTMPDPALCKGGDVTFYVVADQELVVKANAASKFVAHNDATASSVTITQANHHIGQSMGMISDGTSWLYIASIPGQSTATAQIIA
jgi:hypothetical protein